MIFGGLLAGGAGTRMESATMPKQFIRVAGVPIFIRTLKTFLSCENIDKVIISMNTEWQNEYEKLLAEFEIDNNRVELVAGGDSRFTSLINIVKKADELSDNNESIIITHDCARIFVSKEIIYNNIEAVKKYDMVTTSIPTIDTMLYSEDGESSVHVPDRSKLWCDQGPQTFNVNRFLKYLQMVPKSDLPNYIEAGKLFLNHNCKIGIVCGERFNFKVTNDIDLQYAEFLIQRGYVK
jgi:2-C-methyl-D-erythritol 4-phosphate cytidylyltransferase